MFPSSPSTSSAATPHKRGSHTISYSKLSEAEGTPCVDTPSAADSSFGLSYDFVAEPHANGEEETKDALQEDTLEEPEPEQELVEGDEEAVREAEAAALEAVLRELETGSALLVVPRGQRPKFHWVQLGDRRRALLVFDKKAKMPRALPLSCVAGVRVAQPPQVAAIGSPYLGSVSLQIIYFEESKKKKKRGSSGSLQRRELFLLCKAQRERDAWLSGLRHLAPLRGDDQGLGLPLPEEEPELDTQVDERQVQHARETMEQLFQAFQKLKRAAQDPRLPAEVQQWVPRALERVKHQILQAECHVDNAYVLRADAWRVQITVQCLLEKVALVLADVKRRGRKNRFW